MKHNVTARLRSSLEARHPDLKLTDRQTERVLQAALAYSRMGIADIDNSVARAVGEEVQANLLAAKRFRSKGVEERR